eukprot:CAMPEP_0197071102 /NCGR_PEP_ID=MMETSP1384-20130603/204423_1 /TAXON_ID=29189 /ORGANISM="Ammonia sp." /LENGTH=187 /DNA_ID=CAMNT_0042509649 /DNA_START=6 /DNA_END=566 /DNA_ORIENTATION=-
MTLIDIIYEDEDDDDTNNNDEEEADSLMPPILDRQFGLSADSGMSELLIHKNEQLEQQANGQETWIKHKKKKKESHIKAELSLLFEFRDIESKNNRTKEYEESIKNIESEQAQQAMELMKQKTFNAVKIQQEIKEKAIVGFTARLEEQKKLMDAGYTASPLINDEDFVADADHVENINGDEDAKQNE